MVEQLAVDLRLQPLAGTFIDRQGRGSGVLGRAEFIPRQEADDVRFFDAAVGVDRACLVGQPGQHRVLQFAGFGQCVEQCLACRVFMQAVGIQWLIQQVWADTHIPGFNNERVADLIGLGAGFAAERQWAQEDLLAVDVSVRRHRAHQRLHIAITHDGQAVLLANLVFQRLHRQLDLEFAGKQLFPAPCVTGVG